MENQTNTTAAAATSDRRNRAKQHPVLSNLSRELRGLRVSKAFEVYGHTYTLALLAPKDEDWVAERSASAGNNVFEFASKSGKPRIAASLMAIDGVSVAELFLLPDEPDMSPETRKYIESDKTVYNNWLRDEVLAFINTEMDSAVLEQLERNYLQLDTEKKEALKKIGPLSVKTPSNG